MTDIYYTKIWSGNLKKKDYLEDKGVAEKIKLKSILNKQDGKVQIGLIWLRRGTSGELL